MVARILVLEDYLALAKVIQIGLRRMGLDSMHAATVRSALEIEGEFDLAILDIDLPDGNGVDVARRLLDEGRVKEVVFFSATPNGTFAREARTLGFFVDKSYGVEALMVTIRELLPKSSEQTALAKAVGGPDLPTHPSGRSGTRRRVR